MRVVVLIMCGGAGTRFWPASVMKKPKQFLSIFKGEPLIMDAVNRATRITSRENIYMVTTKHLEPQIKAVFPDFPKENIIYEPAIRSTAPCIGLSSLYLKNYDPETVMLILPADHIVPDHEAFENTVRKGIDFVQEKEALLTVGIVPDFPETGFGYIQVKNKIDKKKISIQQVLQFKEKPDEKIAQEYVKSESYFWNAGMFIWKIKDFLSELERESSGMYKEIMKLEEPLKNKDEKAIEAVYNTIPTDSIDYALMEKSSKVYVVPASFKWSDVGSWLALKEFGENFDGLSGTLKHAISINSSGNIVYAPNKMVATMDIKDLIIVDTENTLMILPASKAQNVKEFLKEVKAKKLNDYL